MEQFDVVVIGAGPGGYPAAIHAAQLGAKTAVVEKEWIGGTCLNCGCIPTKALIAGAEMYAEMAHADEYGIKVEGVSFDYNRMVARKNAVVERLRGGINGLFKAHGVKTFSGQASFETKNQVAVTKADGTTERLRANKFIIATGSVSAVPGFLPKRERVVESRGFLALTKLPKRLLVLGGGYIGCELACMAAMLGVKVTIVEMLPDILMLLDPDVRRQVRHSMEQSLGIAIRTGVAMEKVEAGPHGVKARVGENQLEADMLLVSVGRRPFTEGLDLQRAGLDVNEKGFIPVDAFNRTAVANIFAIGDVNGGMQLAHAATSQGLIAAEAACGHAPHRNETLIPGVIFTHPEVALIGLTEETAKAEGIKIKTGKFNFAGLGRALSAGIEGGFVKWIADAETGRLLGAAAVGPRATDLIAEAGLAIRGEFTAAEVGRTVHAHPTFAEIWMEAAHAVDGHCVHQPPPRKA